MDSNVEGLIVEDRRFLICHTIIHDLIGSTIVTLDLASYLQEHGAAVLVYATFVGDPAMSLFAERDLEVVDDAGMEGRSFSDFDVVWVNSQVIPEGMVDQFLDPMPEPMPAFVFLHMSALHFAPDEHPYIHQLEERIASLSLFVSEEARRDLLPYFERSMVTDLYPNPTPAMFAAVRHHAPDTVRRVVVVSNHAAPELMAAKTLLKDKGLEVWHVGQTGDVAALVTPELLADYDVVVTIGKTVQYCLVAGRPAYVYDHFGGYGYLNEENLDHARTWNYSGRHGEQKTAEQIVREIVDGYDDAVTFHEKRRAEFADFYSIEKMVPRVLGQMETREIEPFETSFHHMLRSAQSFGARFFHYWGHNANEVRNRNTLTRDLDHARSEIQELHDHVSSTRDEIHALQTEIRGLHAEIDRMNHSWTFRVGRWFVGPTSTVLRTLRRIVGR